ncbi:ComEA family DNA-binding protein [Bacillus sp. m3-13]|nr:helix-hairpin-helix domain-containing protein [Bacillus sp. m3-13]
MDYRNENGLFKKEEDIMQVTGIGQKSFEKLRNEITVAN